MILATSKAMRPAAPARPLCVPQLVASRPGQAALLCPRPRCPWAYAAATSSRGDELPQARTSERDATADGTGLAVTARQRIAVLQAQKSAALAVEELGRPLAAYMTLPASQYSVLDAKRIERLDADTFRCYVGGLHFLNITVEPVLTLSVIVGEQGPTVRLLSTKLHGSRVVESLNDKFAARMTNVVAWREHVAGAAGGKEIASDTSIEVRLAVPRWFVLPTEVIERAGCAVMARVLETAVPRFLQQLKADYELWAAGNDQRQPVAAGELL